MRGLLMLAALGAVAAAPVHKQAPARPAPRPIARSAPARDWSRAAIRLPSGTFLLGNPQAKVKVAEYLSLTCPHCAPVDLVAIALARCTGPQGFYAVLPILYVSQPQWVEKGYAWLQSAPSPAGKKNDEVLKLVAAGSGLDALFAAHGLPVARQAACFTGPEPATVSKMAADIWKPGFPGTPTFQINGRDVGVLGSWDDLKAKLVAAGA